MKTCDGSCAPFACTTTKVVSLEELERLRSLTDQDVTYEGPFGGFVLVTNDPCPLLANGRCAAYASRPLICESWTCEKCGTQEERERHAAEVFSNRKDRDPHWRRFR